MFLIAVAVVAVLAAGIASIAGFGIGSLLTPLLASQYGMKTAVAAFAIPHLIATALRFWRLRHDVDRRVLVGFGAINAVGSLVGALVHVWVNNPVLSIVLGILLVFAGISGILGHAERMRFGKKLSWGAGALSGAFAAWSAIRVASVLRPCSALALRVLPSSRQLQPLASPLIASACPFISLRNRNRSFVHGQQLSLEWSA